MVLRVWWLVPFPVAVQYSSTTSRAWNVPPLAPFNFMESTVDSYDWFNSAHPRVHFLLVLLLATAIVGAICFIAWAFGFDWERGKAAGCLALFSSIVIIVGTIGAIAASVDQQQALVRQAARRIGGQQ